MLEYFFAHFHICFLLEVLGDKASVVEQVPSFLKIHQHTAQEEDQ